MKDLTAGTQITNGKCKLTVLCFSKNRFGNVALLIRSDGMFVTVRDIYKEQNGDHSWILGHYITDLHDALKDFNERRQLV